MFVHTHLVGGDEENCTAKRYVKGTSMRRQLAGAKRDGKGGYPLKGCLNCNERVCQGCWLTYDHFPTQEKDRLGK